MRRSEYAKSIQRPAVWLSGIDQENHVTPRTRCIRIAFLSILSISTVSTIAQQFTPIHSGVSATAGDTTLQVTALRDDILRIRVCKGGAVPEDASWAVIPSSRTGSVGVIAEPQGFATKQLRVRLDEQFRLTVADFAGNVLQQDAAPVQWQGTRFTVSKRRTSNDHYFGLGDKPGPLDRAGQAFTMWNTDSFGWRESADPIYKSIPFFLEVSHGRALGFFLDNTWRSVFTCTCKLQDCTCQKSMRHS
ncbi:MAG: hypothetical protein WBQ94_20620 [Terracidiphilus sp.]